MDSFFGIGLPELILILLLAGIILGPHQIRRVARTLGHYTAQAQAVAHQFRRQLNAELDAMDSQEMKEALEDVRQLRREMESLRREVYSMPQDLVRDARQARREAERTFKPRSEVPPEAAAPPEGASPAEGADSSELGPDAEKREPDLPPVMTPSRLPQPIDVPDDPEA